MMRTVAQGRRQKGRSGVTLVELMVVLAILGVVAGVAGVSVIAAPRTVTVDETTAAIATARRDALAGGQSVTISVPRPERAPMTITALPDGSVVADTSLRLERLTGAAVDAR